jgi:phospholipase C
MRTRIRVGLVAGAAIVAMLPTVLSSGGAEAGSGLPAHQIKHIVVLMQENRSADTYLGQLSVQGQPGYEAEPTTGNPDPLNPGNTIVPFHKTALCETSDLNHSWNGSHQEWDNGAMDGFTAANDINSPDNSDPADPSGARSMGYYDKTDLPFYNWLYKKWAIGDRYFGSVLSQTFPNRFFLLAGTSFGHIANDLPTSPTEFSQPSIFELLDAANITWKVYFSQIPFAYTFAYVRNHAPGNVVPVDQYYSDAKAGTLPQVSFVDPIFEGAPNVENDEHPPSNVQVGQRFSWRVIKKLERSPQWPTSALFFTYDEHGGFYDHVPPPAAVAPDAIPPMLAAGDTPGGFDRYGFRVPVAVVSPYSKHHFVSHVVHDHTSILRFIEERFGLPALTARDAAADPMFEFFDFSTPHFLSPPIYKRPSVTDCPT